MTNTATADTHGTPKVSPTIQLVKAGPHNSIDSLQLELQAIKERLERYENRPPILDVEDDVAYAPSQPVMMPPAHEEIPVAPPQQPTYVAYSATQPLFPGSFPQSGEPSAATASAFYHPSAQTAFPNYAATALPSFQGAPIPSQVGPPTHPAYSQRRAPPNPMMASSFADQWGHYPHHFAPAVGPRYSAPGTMGGIQQHYGEGYLPHPPPGPPPQQIGQWVYQTGGHQGDYNCPVGGGVSFSSGLQAGYHLPEKIRREIQNDKFVNFYDIKFPGHEPSFDMSVANAESPLIQLKPRRKRDLSEREWLEAFDDFLAVYTEAHPYQLGPLLSYSKFIKNLMATKANWHFYDVEFRRDREINRMAWTCIRVDLQMACNRSAPHRGAEPSRSSPSRSAPQGSRPPSFQTPKGIPMGYCFRFHSSNLSCAAPRGSCPFKHQCPRCAALHPAYQRCGGSQDGKANKPSRKGPANSRQSGRS